MNRMDLYTFTLRPLHLMIKNIVFCGYVYFALVGISVRDQHKSHTPFHILLVYVPAGVHYICSVVFPTPLPLGVLYSEVSCTV